MKPSSFLLNGIVAAVIGLALLPLGLRAQQTIIATPGQVGVAYSYQVTSSATPPVQYGATGLPAGLAINASSGLITGTPTTPGTAIGDVSVTSGGQTNHAALSITIVAAAATPVITSATTASGTVGQAFNYATTASNGPTSFNISGLPANLVANATTGAISGQPAVAGTYSITLSANNASGSGEAVTLTLTVAAPAAAPVITSATSATVAVGAPFNYTITASNTPTSFAASGRPIGIDLDTATGALTGTPTVAGVYTIAMTARNAGGTSAPVNLILTVGALSTITSATTEIAAVGVPYTYNTAANPAATSFNVSGLPAGLSANTTTGVISGTPTTAGVSSISISANNATGTGPATTVSLTIGHRPSITSATSASGTVGSAFTYTITASGAPTSFAAVGLPAGLSLNAATGALTGTPSAAGVSSITLSATNTFGTGATKTLSLTVSEAGGGGGGGGGGGAPIFTSASGATAIVGVPFTFAVQTSPAATHYSATGFPVGITIDATTGAISGTPTVAGVYSVRLVATNLGGTVDQTLTITVNSRPAFTAHPQSTAVAIGGSTTLSVAGIGSPTPVVQWQKNGVPIVGATGQSLTLANFQATDAGSYTAVLTNVAGSVTSQAAVVGVVSTTKVTGFGEVVRDNIIHPNGNVYDQVLLTGSSATITADPGQITRISFIDLDDDIVQVEMSGAGTVTVTLESASGPAAPTKYNQPDIRYMKGHASLIVTGANETTYLSVFSVGTITAVNQALFKPGETYDGMADIGLISIASTVGKMAAIRTGNASYFRAAGMTGIYARGVAVQGPVFVSEISAHSEATPVLVFGSASDLRITGGDLLQLNERPVQVDGISRVQFTAGVTSHNGELPAQPNRARFEKNGVDVTAELTAPVN